MENNTGPTPRRMDKRTAEINELIYWLQQAEPDEIEVIAAETRRLIDEVDARSKVE